ncbi:MAG TPA: C25 family peptidase propeptide domain-containing protein, partial [Ignavibacteriaceae bacterium]
MKFTVSFSFFFILLGSLTFPQQIKVLESTDQNFKVEINFDNAYKIIDTLINGTSAQLIRGKEFYLRNVGEPWLPVYNFSIGVPHSSEPNVRNQIIEKTVFNDKFIIPFPEQDPDFEKYDIRVADKQIYSSNSPFPKSPSEINSDHIFRYSRILNIQVSPFQFNPVSRELIFNKKISVTINYNPTESATTEFINDSFTKSILKTTILNYKEAEKWLQNVQTISDEPLDLAEWYDPTKTYFKIYFNEKGVYRLSYDYLVSQNVPVQGVLTEKLQIFSEGEEVPLYIKDVNQNGIFETGDYCEFVGYPPSLTEFCK